MTPKSILEKAATLDAEQFVQFLDAAQIEYCILDCDLLDYNNEYCNIEVAGFKAGESLLFLDGKLQK
jgi:hypothetical protein